MVQMKNKSILLLSGVVLLLISSFMVSAQGEGGLSGIFSKLLDIGSLKFLGVGEDNQLFGFIRIALAVMIFSIIYMGLSVIPNMSRNVAITVAIVLAIIASVFTPKSILAAMGETYAAIFALLIIGGPIVGLGWLLFGTPTNSRGVAFIKLIGVCFMMWLVNELNYWAAILAGAAL